MRVSQKSGKKVKVGRFIESWCELIRVECNANTLIGGLWHRIYSCNRRKGFLPSNPHNPLPQSALPRMVISGASSRSLHSDLISCPIHPFQRPHSIRQIVTDLPVTRGVSPLLPVEFGAFCRAIQLLERFTAHNKPAITVYKAGTALFKPNKSVRGRRSPCYNSIFMARILNVKHVEAECFYFEISVDATPDNARLRHNLRSRVRKWIETGKPVPPEITVRIRRRCNKHVPDNRCSHLKQLDHTAGPGKYRAEATARLAGKVAHNGPSFLRRLSGKEGPRSGALRRAEIRTGSTTSGGERKWADFSTRF
ncbi:hypothetical protein TcasGA2_TC012649 [Tribolium castaneum]|uniref:Uncharacterized protein n=1 Tax=Tribolium castaneum TaxID=7070 RepID=D6WZD2_TRICA|nr:hypothetical protein TcasGA2_TC012649 [Tribolium castaneum]